MAKFQLTSIILGYIAGRFTLKPKLPPEALKQLNRFAIIDMVTGRDLIADRNYRVEYHTYLPNLFVDVYRIMMNKSSYSPYSDVQFELVVTRKAGRWNNAVIIDKGDNAKRILLDGKLVEETEQITQDRVYMWPTKPEVRKKWIALNFWP